MNTRRLSFGLLVTFATAMLAACGESTPEAQTPAASAAPVETAAPAAPPSAAEPAPPPPAPAPAPAPPPKPAKEKIIGTFVQDFSGDVATAAQAVADKAGGKKKDDKKIQASLDKAKKAFADQNSTLVITADTLTWNLKGKPAHAITYTTSGDDPTNLTLKLGKDGKKDLKGMELGVSFGDDTTISFKDPFAKKDPQTLVFKKQ